MEPCLHQSHYNPSCLLALLTGVVIRSYKRHISFLLQVPSPNRIPLRGRHSQSGLPSLQLKMAAFYYLPHFGLCSTTQFHSWPSFFVLSPFLGASPLSANEELKPRHMQRALWYRNRTLCLTCAASSQKKGRVRRCSPPRPPAWPFMLKPSGPGPRKRAHMRR